MAYIRTSVNDASNGSEDASTTTRGTVGNRLIDTPEKGSGESARDGSGCRTVSEDTLHVIASTHTKVKFPVNLEG